MILVLSASLNKTFPFSGRSLHFFITCRVLPFFTWFFLLAGCFHSLHVFLLAGCFHSLHVFLLAGCFHSLRFFTCRVLPFFTCFFTCRVLPFFTFFFYLQGASILYMFFYLQGASILYMFFYLQGASILYMFFYLQGASILYMLSTFLGKDNFKTGLTAYLNKYKYANAETNDLWNSLQEVRQEYHDEKTHKTKTKQESFSNITLQFKVSLHQIKSN